MIFFIRKIDGATMFDFAKSKFDKIEAFLWA
jgi:hypothetical protein